jgi:hypothetical protein
MVDEASAQTGCVQSRIRDLPSRVVVYLLLAACLLFPEAGYPGVWRKLTAGLAGLPVAAPTPGALQARRRVGTAPLRFLFDVLRGPAVLSRERGTHWRGLLVCAIDGTIMTVPDSPANLTRFTKGAGRTAALATPRRGCWRWRPAGPAPSSTRCAARPPAGRPPVPRTCCAACGRACSCWPTATSPPGGYSPRSPPPKPTSWSGSRPAGVPPGCPSRAARPPACAIALRLGQRCQVFGRLPFHGLPDGDRPHAVPRPAQEADRPTGRRRAGVPPTRHRARGPTACAQA